jgi:hypothetical protein
MKQARLPLVETLRMKRILKFEHLIVEVVDNFVKQRAEKGLERNHLPPLDCPHPEGDKRSSLDMLHLIETMEFSI